MDGMNGKLQNQTLAEIEAIFGFNSVSLFSATIHRNINRKQLWK